MFKLKSVVVATVFLAASVGAFADQTFALGTRPVPSTTGVNDPAFDLVSVIDGASFTDTYTFSIGSGATVSAAIYNDAVFFGGTYLGGIASFAGTIDGTKVLFQTGPTFSVVDGLSVKTLSLGLTQTFQIASGAHQLVISGITDGQVGAVGSVYHGSLTLSPAAPVPEPESYAMMLAGLAALGFMASRRRQG